METMEFGVFHLFSGMGSGALGFARAQETYLGMQARFRTLGGVDVDPEACRDFEMLTGVPATCRDLFSRDDYIAFHGHEPPDGWQEVTPADLRAAAGGVRPDVVFTSSPCKGLSGLLPQASAATEKYQALNRLTVRGIALTLGAWADHLPGLIIFENVPRITSRGAELLDQIKALLTRAGYRLDETTHDLGEVGGLAQHRRRYLLVARHPGQVPAPLYVPPKRKVRAIGDELSRLPLPDAPSAGPLHRLPRLTWRTWVRLALIPAGGDWRDLQAIGPDGYRIVPQDVYYKNSYRVTAWTAPAGTVTGGMAPSNGGHTVADPRVSRDSLPFSTIYRVTGGRTTPIAVPDEKFDPCACDPRIGHAPRKGVFQIGRWDEPGHTIIGSARVGGSNGIAAVADPRVPERASRRSGQMAVLDWNEAAPTVTSEDSVGSGALSVADPRIPTPQETGTWVIISEDNTWHRPLTTLELAVLQGLPARLPNGEPLVLAGKSQARFRERIGNAVPVPAAEAVARMMLMTLMAAQANILMLNVYATAVWVRNYHRHIWTSVTPPRWSPRWGGGLRRGI